MRFLYIDEAGRSSKEAVCVTVAAIINADRQWLELERYHRSIVEEFIPEPDRDGMVFHATALFSGTRYFKREAWPREVRMEILRKILAARTLYGLPLSIGYSFNDEGRRALLSPRHQSEKDYAQYRHTEAFALCVGGCERYIRDIGMVDELALAIVEDVPDARRHLKAIFKQMKQKGGFDSDVMNGALPFRHIADTPLFAEKPEAPLLQFADAFAFAVRRWLGKFSHGQELMQTMLGATFKHAERDSWHGSGVIVYAGREERERKGGSGRWALTS